MTGVRLLSFAEISEEAATHQDTHRHPRAASARVPHFCGGAVEEIAHEACPQQESLVTQGAS
ncbi:hypothetical protein [Mycobacterium helveticum]|uniref:Uncharacterized protein n=1 Tax=Mycobacterium helveticum TaxID=2592811 RepID=A0A557XWT0_9MYCO|nr:hypothetical protein [Mycobacterium helveticum]TVS88091.1 hypothetical protein FPZ46_06220 [Mycobacterium helveticum]TVS90538.1 hypothetical protein FPZ47_08900 [Mycobacterium helveticum]